MELSTLEAELRKRNYVLEHLIYTGQTVKVYNVKQGELPAVVKDIAYPHSMAWERAVQEVNIVLTLDHPRIVKIYDYFQYFSSPQTWQLVIVFERLAKDLMKDIQDRNRNKYMWRPEELLGLYVELAEAFAYLQEQGVVHRDIKPQNILIANGHIKVTDFGTSKNGSISFLLKINNWTVTGTPYFLSPQVKREFSERKDRVDHIVIKSDVYSLGLTFLIMAKLESPSTLVRFQSLSRITTEVTADIVYGDTIKNIIRWMLQEDETKRPDFIDLLGYLRRLALPAPAEEPQVAAAPANIFGCSHVLSGTPAVVATPCHGQLCAQCAPITIEELGFARYHCVYCYHFSHQLSAPVAPQEIAPVQVPQVQPSTLTNVAKNKQEEQKGSLEHMDRDSAVCAECLLVRSRALLLPQPGSSQLLCQNCISYYEKYEKLRYGRVLGS